MMHTLEDFRSITATAERLLEFLNSEDCDDPLRNHPSADRGIDYLRDVAGAESVDDLVTQVWSDPQGAMALIGSAMAQEHIRERMSEIADGEDAPMLEESVAFAVLAAYGLQRVPVQEIDAHPLEHSGCFLASLIMAGVAWYKTEQERAMVEDLVNQFESQFA